MMLEKKHKFTNLIISLIFIDILLLPNFPLFIMPMSLPVVTLVLILRKVRIAKDKESFAFFILGVLVLTSVLVSFFYENNYIDGMNVWIENTNRAFQLLSSFFYYFVIKHSNLKSHVKIKNILIIYVTVYSVLGIISYFNIALYFKILNLLSVYNPFVSDWYLRQRVELFRYSYILADPNNSAYMFQMIIFYMLLNEKLKTFEKLYLYFSLILSLMLSMSTGALLSAFLFFFIYFGLRMLQNYKINYKRIFVGLLTLCLGIIIGGIIFLLFRDNFTFLGKYSLERMLNNTGGGRIEKYFFMFKDKLPNLIGEGYILLRNGDLFRPHSDHLRFMYSYGMIAYIISLWFFFRHIWNSSKFMFLIPGFMAYSINSLIDEQKVIIILLSLIAYTKYKSNSINYSYKRSKIDE